MTSRISTLNPDRTVVNSLLNQSRHFAVNFGFASLAAILLLSPWYSIHSSASKWREWSEILGVAQTSATEDRLLHFHTFIIRFRYPVTGVLCLWCCLSFLRPKSLPVWKSRFFVPWAAMTLLAVGVMWLLCSWAAAEPGQFLLRELNSVPSPNQALRHTQILEDATSSKDQQRSASDALSKLSLPSRMGLSTDENAPVRQRLLKVAANIDLPTHQRFEAARALLPLELESPADRSIVISAIRAALIDTDPDLRAMAAQFLKHPVMNVTTSTPLTEELPE